MKSHSNDNIVERCAGVNTVTRRGRIPIQSRRVLHHVLNVYTVLTVYRHVQCTLCSVHSVSDFSTARVIDKKNRHGARGLPSQQTAPVTVAVKSDRMSLDKTTTAPPWSGRLLNKKDKQTRCEVCQRGLPCPHLQPTVKEARTGWRGAPRDCDKSQAVKWGLSHCLRSRTEN